MLDTNIVSALMKGDPSSVAHLRSHDRSEIVIPQPVLAEIAYGIERLPRSKRKSALRDRFNLVRSEIGRIQWTDSISEAYGTIKARLEKQGRRIEDFDAAIAAHARHEDVVLVTANAEHLQRVPGIRIEDWSRP